MRCFALLLLIVVVPVWAHLLPAQTGTLRLVDDKAYLALGVPIDAVLGDHAVSSQGVTLEVFEARQEEIVRRLEGSFMLYQQEIPLPLLDFRVQPEIHYQGAWSGVSQITVMAIFALGEAPQTLRFAISLWSPGEDNLPYQLRVSRAEGRVDEFELTPDQPFFEFASAAGG